MRAVLPGGVLEGALLLGVLLLAGLAFWLFRRLGAARARLAALEAEIAHSHLRDGDLLAAKETAESRSLAKSKYVRGISHELRTPLNAVLGYAQLLEANPEIPAHLKHGIRVIRRSGDHLSSLVDGLLDISMIEAGKLQIYRNDVQLGTFLRQIADMFSLQAREKGLVFVADFAPNLPQTVRIDEKRLRQILINLLSNALRCTQDGQIAFRVGFSGQVARFDIEDTGVGIAEDDLDRIFQPFERLNEKMGTGLGLTITKALVAAMGGEITVTSAKGVGSKFSIRMMLSPVLSPVIPEETVLERVTGYEGARRTILVTDDDPHHVAFMREMLGSLGFVVLSAENGADCLRLAAEHAPDAVLLDVSMPGMDGWDVAGRLRQARPALPIVMISADARQEMQRVEFAARHDAYLIKPLRFSALLEELQKLLGLEWRQAGSEVAAFSVESLGPDEIPDAAQLEALRRLGQIGHIRGILGKLDEIEREAPQCAVLVGELRLLAQTCDLESYAALLEQVG